jgi:hypothetical protein
MGDICVGVNFVNDTHHLGVECVVIEPLQRTRFGECYLVRWADEDHDRYAYPYTLRLKRPPSNYDGNLAGDWGLCPFNPYKQRVRV